MVIKDTESLGKALQEIRQQMGLTQADLAMTAGTGVRFIVDIEKGKPTCQVGKALTLLQTLGARLMVEPPAGIRVPPNQRGEATEDHAGNA